MTRRRLLDRRPLHRGYRLAGIKPELGVKRKRTIVEGGLKKPSTLAAQFCGAGEGRLHECASDALILDVRIDGNRPKTCNRGAPVEAVAAQDLAT